MSQRQITSNCIVQKQGKKQKNFPSISFVWIFYRGNNEVNLIESEAANEENRYSSHNTGGNRRGDCRRCFCHKASRDDKSRTETRKDKKGRKSVCRQIPDEHIAWHQQQGSFRNGPCDIKKCDRWWFEEYLRAQLGSRYFAGENEPEKESVQNRDNLGKNRRTYFADW